MIKILFSMMLLLLALDVNATGQDGDIVYISGEQWELLGKPIGADSVITHDLKAVLPKDRVWTTANWSGYTAYWSIKQDMLCLDSIVYERRSTNSNKCVSECIPVDTMVHVFRRYTDGSRIVAGWLTGEIRVARGKVIYYEHMGFDRNYEEELFISIDHGKVVGERRYHNYKVDGFSFEEDFPKSLADLHKMFPLHFEQYSEMADVKRILFKIKQARVDEHGRLVECEVDIIRPTGHQRLASEIAESLKAYYPWRVLYINGEYRAYGIAGFVFPYQIEE